jgi:hypothetical protein
MKKEESHDPIEHLRHLQELSECDDETLQDISESIKEISLLMISIALENKSAKK